MDTCCVQILNALRYCFAPAPFGKKVKMWVNFLGLNAVFFECLKLPCPLGLPSLLRLLCACH